MVSWERQWRSAGVGFFLLLIVAGIFYGNQPKQGASAEQLVSFFHGDRTRILIATVIFCFAFLELLWFGAALSSVLRDAGKGGWAAAATASSTAMAGILFLRMTVRAALAFSIAGSGSAQIASGVADLGWVLSVILAFPAAMFAMAGAFGLRRAGLISNRFFAIGVLVVVVGLLGGTTWASDGFWSPDGAYSVISQIVVFVWIAVLSGFLAMRSPSPARTSDRVPVTA
jgi:hypothetical protein